MNQDQSPDATNSPASRLVNTKKLLEENWPDETCRPSVRWIERQRKKKRIPFIKFGHYVWFNPEQVRSALNAQPSAHYGVSR